MASGNLSPRQKMINMMYLVLIALLALNVSKEILKSFQLFESSFEKAQDNVNKSTNSLMATFNKQQKNDPSLRPLYAKAEEVRSTTGTFMTYMNKVKKDVEEGAGGRITVGHMAGEIKNADDMESHANYFMVENYNGKEGGRGIEFEQKINDYRKNMVKLLTTGDSNSRLPQKIVNQMEQSSGLFTVISPLHASMINGPAVLLDVSPTTKLKASFWNYKPQDIPPGSVVVVPRDAAPFNLVAFSERIFGLLSNLAVTAAALSTISRN